MLKFATWLIVSLLLIGIWYVTLLLLHIDTRVYLTAAPWWHLGLHLAWFLSLWLTCTVGIAWYEEHHARRRHALADLLSQYAAE
jgi:hypothetical protein